MINTGNDACSCCDACRDSLGVHAEIRFTGGANGPTPRGSRLVDETIVVGDAWLGNVLRTVPPTLLHEFYTINRFMIHMTHMTHLYAALRVWSVHSNHFKRVFSVYTPQFAG
jgi:hypothetical protein